MSEAANLERERSRLVVVGCRAGEIAIGCMLGISAVIHYSNPYLFAENVAAYGLFSAELVLVVATIVMSLSLVLGASLIAGVWSDCSILLSAGLLSVFVGAQIYALLSGLNIDCGCFGGASSRIGVLSMSVPFLGAVLAGSIYWFQYRRAVESVTGVR